MVSYKDPLSKNPNNVLSQRFTGAGGIDVMTLVNEMLSSVPKKVESDFGFKVSGIKETVTIGGFFSKKNYPGILFQFPGKPNYAHILVSFNKIGSVIDIDAVTHGGVSRNMQHANLAKMDHGFSLSGIATSVYHKAMTNSNAIEEEEMHYDALLAALQEVIESWKD